MSMSNGLVPPLLALLVGLVLGIVAAATAYWFSFTVPSVLGGASAEIGFGPWRTCVKPGGIGTVELCGFTDFGTEGSPSSWPGAFIALKVLTILTLVLMTSVLFYCAVMTVRKSAPPRRGLMGCGVALAVALLMALATLIIFPSINVEVTWFFSDGSSDMFGYGYSYGLWVAATVLCLVSAGLIFRIWKRSDDELPRVHNDVTKG